MTAPAPAPPSSPRPLVVSSLSSDLDALRSIIRLLDILADDYAAETYLRGALRLAARWASRTLLALQERSNHPTPQRPNDTP